MKHIAVFHYLGISALLNAKGLAQFKNTLMHKVIFTCYAQRIEKLQHSAQYLSKSSLQLVNVASYLLRPSVSHPLPPALYCSPPLPLSLGRLNLICLQLVETEVTGLAAGTEEICDVNSSLSCEMNKLGVEKEIHAKSTFPVLVKLFLLLYISKHWF